MAEGIRACGDAVEIVTESQWGGELEGDVAVFYGLEGKTPALFEHYSYHAKAVYIDLGYWGRREGGRWAGFHKIVVNARHPNAYLMRSQQPDDRLAYHVLRGNTVLLPRTAAGTHILLAGMGDKGAIAEGFEPHEWETEMVRQIRAVTDRPILYRAKPSWKGVHMLDHCGHSPRERTIEEELRDCHAVVTHHSNAAVDAVMAGVPAFVWGGVGTFMGNSDIRKLEAPNFPPPGARERWAANLAYVQWSIAEMRQGLPWAHLRQEKLLCR